MLRIANNNKSQCFLELFANNSNFVNFRILYNNSNFVFLKCVQLVFKIQNKGNFKLKFNG